MTHSSPYAPPKAAVRDRVPEPLLAKMPKEIVLAVGLLWLQLALAGVSAYLEYLRSPEDERPFLVVVYAVVLALVAVLNVCIARRRNWARWLYLVLVAVGVALLPSTIEDMAGMPDHEIALDAVTYILDFAIVALLFARPGALWFRFRPAP